MFSSGNGSIGAQVEQNHPLIPEQNEGFATTMGPQEAISVAKLDLVAPPDSTGQRLTAALARINSEPIEQILAVAVTQQRVVVVHAGGRPQALDAAAKQKVCLLLKVGYTRSLAAAELGVARSTITRTMKRDPEFRRQVLNAEELFERTPLLTVLEAAQRNWRAAAWLMKNYQPHSSVSRRKRRRKLREDARHSKDWFKATSEALEAGLPSPKTPGTTTTTTRRGNKVVTKSVRKS